MKPLVAIAAAFVVFSTGCGYRPLHAARPESEALAVVVVASHVTPQVAADDVAGGARASLAESGLLRSGVAHPRVEIEVVRIDEESEAIGEVAAGGSPVPKARGLRVGVVARGWVRRGAGTPPEGDTGDVRAFVVMAAENQPGLASELVFERAVRAAARRVGGRIGARIAGHPAASE